MDAPALAPALAPTPWTTSRVRLQSATFIIVSELIRYIISGLQTLVRCDVKRRRWVVSTPTLRPSHGHPMARLTICSLPIHEGCSYLPVLFTHHFNSSY